MKQRFLEKRERKRFRWWVCIVPVLLGFPLLRQEATAQSPEIEDTVAIYGCNPIGRRLLMVTRSGDGRDRNAELSIIELSEPDRRLRILHQLRTNVPLEFFSLAVSDCGRFVITMGDARAASGTLDRDLVIYDLVRNEQSAYSVNDFLSAESIERLSAKPPPFPVLHGLVWQRGFPGFDYVKMEFYPTVPQKCRYSDSEVPFVVVDLLSRTVRTEAIPDEDFPEWTRASYFHSPRWIASAGNGLLPPAGEPLRLPAFLRVEFGEEGARQRRVFRLDEGTGDYLLVPEADWPDERLPLITAGMYREAESERGVQRRE